MKTAAQVWEELKGHIGKVEFYIGKDGVEAIDKAVGAAKPKPVAPPKVTPAKVEGEDA